MTRRRFGPTVLDGDAQKTPLADSLNRFATAKAMDAIRTLGMSLPCKVVAVVSPGIVTVAFAATAKPGALPQVTVPIMFPPYIALPVRVGDVGECIAASVRLGELTGLGAGTPSIWDQPANLATLAFAWLGTTSLTTLDPDAVVVMSNLIVSADKLGFFGNAKAAQRSLIGALSAVTDPNAKAVLQSIVTALCDSGYGLTKDETS